MIHPVLDQNYIEVMEAGQLDRIPLNIFSRSIALPANPVGVYRGLIPVDVQDDVVDVGSGYRGHSFLHSTGCEPAFPFDNVDNRRILRIEI